MLDISKLYQGGFIRYSNHTTNAENFRNCIAVILKIESKEHMICLRVYLRDYGQHVIIWELFDSEKRQERFENVEE